MKLSHALLSGALAVAAGLPIVGFAQQAPGKQPPAAGARHHQGHMRFLRGIDLSDQQRQQIQTIVQQYRQAHPPGTPPDKTSREALRQSVMNVLTPQQQAQAKANIEKAREERKERREKAPQPSPSPSI